MYLNYQLKALALGLTAAAAATDTAIHKKMFGLGTTLITLKKEINDIMNMVQSLEESGLLIKGVGQTIKNEAKEKENFSEC